MTLLADKNLATQLDELDEVTLIRDATGRVLGYFTPLVSDETSQLPETVTRLGLTAAELAEQFEQFRAGLSSQTPVVNRLQ